jgi:hypothetical protein
MSENERDEFLDHLLDDSLRRYAQVEPRPGLRSRLLAGVPERARRTGWPQWAWIAAAAAVVVVLGVSPFYLGRAPTAGAPSTVTHRPLQGPNVAASAPAPTLAPSVPQPGGSRRKMNRIDRTEHSGRAPRLATFPSRAPIREQERLLLRFVQQTPKEQLIAQQLGATPIERLDIRPLFVPRLGSDALTTVN